MSTHEKIIRRAIATIKKRLAKIEGIISSKPIADLARIRQEITNLLAEEKKSQLPLKVFEGRFKLLKKQYNTTTAIVKKQENLVALLQEKSRLSIELANLNNDLYFIERKNNT